MLNVFCYPLVLLCVCPTMGCIFSFERFEAFFLVICEACVCVAVTWGWGKLHFRSKFVQNLSSSDIPF